MIKKYILILFYFNQNKFVWLVPLKSKFFIHRNKTNKGNLKYEYTDTHKRQLSN